MMVHDPMLSNTEPRFTRTVATRRALHSIHKPVFQVRDLALGQLNEELEKSKPHLDKALQKLERLFASGKIHDAKHQVTRILQSPACKLVAVYEARRKMGFTRARIVRNRFLETSCSARLNDNVLHDVVEQLNFFQPCDEPVRVLKRRKRNGGTRFIYKFGILHRAAQILLRKILQVFWGPTLLPSQYALNGGRSACLEAVKQQIEANSFSVAAELDIQNFFPSIRIEWLEEKLWFLPKEVIRSYLTSERLQVWCSDVLTNHQRMCLINDRSGIPQGSHVSPFIAEYVVSQIMGGCSQWPTYVDNVLILGKSGKAVREQIHALESVFSTHPAGPFRLTLGPLKRLAKPFEFLGFEISVRRGQIKVGPSEKNRALLLRRVYDRWKKGDTPQILERSISAWTAGFSFSQDRAEAFAELRAKPFALFLATAQKRFWCFKAADRSYLSPIKAFISCDFDV